MNFGFMAPTVAGLQEEPGCKTSGVADSALKASNGKPCLTRSGSRADVRCEASSPALHRGGYSIYAAPGNNPAGYGNTISRQMQSRPL